jgi:hypothetical protein
LDLGLYVMEAALGFLFGAVCERTDELVIADAHDWFVGAQVSLNRSHDVAQQRVPRSMAELVVDLLESVDVDHGQYETPLAVASSVALMLERDHSERTSERSGEMIELGVPELRLCLLAVVFGGRAVGPRRGPVRLGTARAPRRRVRAPPSRGSRSFPGPTAHEHGAPVQVRPRLDRVGPRLGLEPPR